MTLLYKNITLFILLRVKASVERERHTDGRRRMETATVTHNFFSWPYHVLSSRPNLTLLLLLSRGGGRSTQPEARSVKHCPSEVPNHLLALPWMTALLWQQAMTPRLRLTPPVSHVGIYINHFITPTHFRSTTWLLLLIFPGESCAENLRFMAQSGVNMQHTVVSRSVKATNKLSYIEEDFIQRRFYWIYARILKELFITNC